MHRGRCPRQYCYCKNGVPRFYRIQFLPIEHGRLIDLGRRPHELLGFKRGGGRARQGWLVYAIAEDTQRGRPRLRREKAD